MQYISNHGILTSLSLVSTAVRAHSFESLTTVDVRGRDNITDAVARQLSKLIALTTLNVRGCRNITDAGLAELSKLNALTTLDVSYCGNITDAGLAELSKLRSLTTLLHHHGRRAR